MMGRRRSDFPSRKTEEVAFAAKGTDLDALRSAVVDAAGVGYGLWFSYLFALLYFAIAAGAVTHRDLLLESPVKLPFLNVELPLTAFFILGPLVFLVVHAYVLLHFLLLAGKVGAFHEELRKQIPEENTRAQLRLQLPSNIFVQFLSGPREVREGIVGFLLKSVACVSLVAGPIALLVLFLLQFLPYHNAWITWWQRIAVLLDLILLWLLWPPIARGDFALLSWNDPQRMKVATWLAASVLPILLAFTVATFPGEWLVGALLEVALVPTQWPTWRSENTIGNQGGATQRETGPADPKTERNSGFRGRALEAWKSMGWTSPYKLLVAGDVDYFTPKPKSLWSNRLMLPDFDIGGRLRFDTEGKITLSSGAVSSNGRRLEGVVFRGAHLQRADFTGAQLTRADLGRADLSWANMSAADLSRALLFQANLTGALLNGANLTGAVLTGANLSGADLAQAALTSAGELSLVQVTHPPSAVVDLARK
jgi:hypothetical protein